jgi:hypothetical protein
MAMQNTDHAQWLEETFARNRALYGGFKMELEGEGNEDESDKDESGTEGNEGGDDTGSSNEENSEENNSEEEVPVDVLRANLTKANQEAARYRTRLREVEKALEERKSPEEVEELIANLKTERESAERALLIENVALKHNLPNELAELLKGETREALEEHAKVLAKFAPKSNEGDEVPPGDLDGGLNPGNDGNDDGLDPRERYRKIKGLR